MEFKPNNGPMKILDEEQGDGPKALHRRLATRRLARAETVYFLALAAYAILAVLARDVLYFRWDLWLESGLQQIRSPLVATIFTAISLPGNFSTPYVLTTVVVLAFWFFGHRSEAVGLVVSAGGAGMLNRLMKMIIARPRPTAPLVQVLDADRSGASFPSGHVAFYVCFFGFLFFVAYALLPRGSWMRRFALALTAFPVVTVGLSRVYLGAHWPSDTVGAYLWSGVWLAIVLRLYLHWKANATFHRTNRQSAEAS
jgi:membrane-associated phospholipid phosphatase